MRWVALVVAMLAACGDNHVLRDASIDGASDGAHPDACSAFGVLSAACVPPSPAELRLDPLDIHFGAVPIGTSSLPAGLVLVNHGGQPSGSISVTLMGASASFEIVENTCTTLEPNAACTLGVTCVPTNVGAKAATLVVTASPGGTTTTALDCVAVTGCNILVTPSVQVFDPIAVGGTSATATFTVSNTCGFSTGVLATSIAGTAASDFEIVSDTCVGTTLAGGASCTLQVRFAPGASGSRQATLQVLASPGGSVTAALTGTGLAP